MLPNKLVWNYQNIEDTYLHSYGENILHILTYLDCMTNRLGKTFFTIEHMITTSGLKVDTHKGKSFYQFKNILADLQSKGIIETDIDLNKVNVKEGIYCILNMPIDKDINNNNIKFFNITRDKYLEIMDRYSGKLKKLTLLKVYYYINSRIERRKSIITSDGKRLSNDIEVFGGKAECFYDKYENISKDLKISEDTWNLYIKELQNMELLFYNNIGKVKKDNKSHNANNVYCIDKSELSEALKQSKLYYLDEGYTIIGKKTNGEIKVMNGLKGKIKQEQNRGKDTSNLENKLEKLQNKCTKKNNKTKEKTIEDKIELEDIFNNNIEVRNKPFNGFYENIINSRKSVDEIF